MITAVVVGAGFAGLSAALELARAGVNVTVFEAAGGAGGVARRFTTSGGFSFDAGPTIVVMPDVLRSVLGDDRFDALDLRLLEPGYRVSWPDGSSFDLTSDVAALLESVGRFTPAPPPSRTLAYLSEVHEQYLAARHNILDRDHNAATFAAMLLQPGRFRSWVFSPLERFVASHFGSARVVEALTFQSLYLGTSPLRAPAIYAMLAVEEIVGGIWYARGGTGALVDALVDACRAAGVRFEFQSAVTRIRTELGRAIAVRVGDVDVWADATVVACDRQWAVDTLLPSKPNRLKRYGHSAYVWYLGIDRRVDGPHHQVFLPDDPRGAYVRLDEGSLPDEPMVYCCNPVVSDETVAPAGCSALFLLSPVPNARSLPEIDEGAYFDRALSVAERHLGPLRSHIVERHSRGPLDLATQFNLHDGAAFGPDHRLDQMGPFRPSIRHPKIGNLVFAGAGTHPGSGVPMVLISGRLAARRLLKACA